MSKPKVGQRRKLAKDIRPGDTFTESLGHRFTATEVAHNLRSGLVRIRTVEKVQLTLTANEAVTP